MYEDYSHHVDPYFRPAFSNTTSVTVESLLKLLPKAFDDSTSGNPIIVEKLDSLTGNYWKALKSKKVKEAIDHLKQIVQKMLNNINVCFSFSFVPSHGTIVYYQQDTGPLDNALEIKLGFPASFNRASTINPSDGIELTHQTTQNDKSEVVSLGISNYPLSIDQFLAEVPAAIKKEYQSDKTGISSLPCSVIEFGKRVLCKSNQVNYQGSRMSSIMKGTSNVQDGIWGIVRAAIYLASHIYGGDLISEEMIDFLFKLFGLYICYSDLEDKLKQTENLEKLNAMNPPEIRILHGMIKRLSFKLRESVGKSEKEVGAFIANWHFETENNLLKKFKSIKETTVNIDQPKPITLTSNKDNFIGINNSEKKESFSSISDEKNKKKFLKLPLDLQVEGIKDEPVGEKLRIIEDYVFEICNMLHDNFQNYDQFTKQFNTFTSCQFLRKSIEKYETLSNSYQLEYSSSWIPPNQNKQIMLLFCFIELGVNLYLAISKEKTLVLKNILKQFKLPEDAVQNLKVSFSSVIPKAHYACRLILQILEPHQNGIPIFSDSQSKWKSFIDAYCGAYENTTTIIEQWKSERETMIQKARHRIKDLLRQYEEAKKQYNIYYNKGWWAEANNKKLEYQGLETQKIHISSSGYARRDEERKAAAMYADLFCSSTSINGHIKFFIDSICRLEKNWYTTVEINTSSHFLVSHFQNSNSNTSFNMFYSTEKNVEARWWFLQHKNDDALVKDPFNFLFSLSSYQILQSNAFDKKKTRD